MPPTNMMTWQSSGASSSIHSFLSLVFGPQRHIRIRIRFRFIAISFFILLSKPLSLPPSIINNQITHSSFLNFNILGCYLCSPLSLFLLVMSLPHLRNSRVSHLLLFSSLFFFTFLPGLVLSAVVTLGSMEIFTTHEWLKHTPTVYFMCKGENKTVLPDVKEKHVSYAFQGEESWQPLTDFLSKKCKRCGLYEEDSIMADDVFDEWELCPTDFTTLDGKYVRFKEKEFNATFLCPDCLSFFNVSVPAPVVNENARKGKEKGKGKNVAVVVSVSILVSAIVVLLAVGAYKFWQKKKREQDQARFLKLFEEGDDIEDELDLGPMI